MGIVTKRGDGGSTCLGCGRSVPKDHIAIETCGELDELGSCLGVAKSLVSDSRARAIIESGQKNLFVIGAEIACGPKRVGGLKKRLWKNDVGLIEKSIAAVEKKCPSKMKRFTVAGKNHVSGVMDLARTVARRAERRVVTLKKKGLLKNRYILIYLNRLSDLLYLLARCLEKEE